jgi:hypothetical protein
MSDTRVNRAKLASAWNQLAHVETPIEPYSCLRKGNSCAKFQGHARQILSNVREKLLRMGSSWSRVGDQYLCANSSELSGFCRQYPPTRHLAWWLQNGACKHQSGET